MIGITSFRDNLAQGSVPGTPRAQQETPWNVSVSNYDKSTSRNQVLQ